MSALRQALQSLPENERQQLLYALEEGLNQWIELPDGKFIGVNVQGLKQLIILESNGNWAFGEIRE